MGTTTELSAQEAINLLNQNPEQYSSKEALKALADRVSVYSPRSGNWGQVLHSNTLHA